MRCLTEKLIQFPMTSDHHEKRSELTRRPTKGKNLHTHRGQRLTAKSFPISASLKMFGVVYPSVTTGLTLVSSHAAICSHTIDPVCLALISLKESKLSTSLKMNREPPGRTRFIFVTHGTLVHRVYCEHRTTGGIRFWGMTSKRTSNVSATNLLRMTLYTCSNNNYVHQIMIHTCKIQSTRMKKH